MNAARPWDRREGESTPAWQAFRRYRDLGPERTISAASQGIGKAGSLLRRWSAEHAWIERAAAWDDAVGAALDVEVAESHRQATRDRLDAAARLRTIALEALDALDPAQVSPADAVRFLEAADRLSTTARRDHTTLDREAAHADMNSILDSVLDDLRTEAHAGWAGPDDR